MANVGGAGRQYPMKGVPQKGGRLSNPKTLIPSLPPSPSPPPLYPTRRSSASWRLLAASRPPGYSTAACMPGTWPHGRRL